MLELIFTYMYLCPVKQAHSLLWLAVMKPKLEYFYKARETIIFLLKLDTH